MRLLIISSAVGVLGDGATGGVSDVLYSTINVLCENGYQVDVLAEQSSVYQGAARLIGIAGRFQPSIVSINERNDRYPIIASSLIANYWNYVQEHIEEYDVIINLCQDWLPYYLTSFISKPVLHMPNICNENSIVTEEIQNIALKFPKRIAVLSYAQANALGIKENGFLCGYGFDQASYTFRAQPDQDTLIWAARICVEKGLQDAAEIAMRANKRLLVCGYIQDPSYFESIIKQYSETIEYLGFLSKDALISAMGRAEALLCTHKCTEAFGLVVIESLACGTPVITYNRGGPAEIVSNSKTGFIVAADDVSQALKAITKLSTIRREDCRTYCQQNYNLNVYGKRLVQWIKQTIHSPL